MSGYEQPENASPNAHDSKRPSQVYCSLPEYDAPRPSQEPMYLQYAVAGAGDPQMLQPSTAYDQQSDHMNYEASPIYHPRATLEATPSAYNNFEPRKTLQVSSPNPQRGTKGTQLYHTLYSSSDLLSPTLNATLMFATYPAPARLIRVDPQEQGVYYKYLVSARAPAFSETGSSSLRIPLSLQLQEASGLNIGLIGAGEWLYEDGKQLEHRSSPHEISHKRKVTDEPSDAPRSTKRATPSEQLTTQPPEYGSYPHASASLAYPQSLDLNNMQRKLTAYGRSQLQQSLQAESDAMGLQCLIGGASISQSLMRPPMGQTSSWTSSYGAGYQSDRRTQSTAAPSFQVSSMSSPSTTDLPLKRTTQLPSQSSTAARSDGSFNPYTSHSTQAVLELQGNMDVMQVKWTPEERAVKRRVVRFRREQHGLTINLYFEPVRAEEQHLPHETNERRISCIYWEERAECYITSVDTILLLECVLGEKFETEEKNRIRRNLEGYKPCTISKVKPDSEGFFKQIMGLPSPKPRIIEKDVKVFKWAILEQALKKVVSKYSEDTTRSGLYQSTSPSSTAGSSRRQPKSEAGVGQSSALSSRSTSGSTASGPYGQTLKSSTFSPSIASRGLSGYSPASSLQSFAASGLPHSYNPSLDSPYISNDMSNSPYAPQVSIPNLSSPYTASTAGHRRSSDAPTDDIASSTSHYSWHSLASPYSAQDSGKATLGLPGRASKDLSAAYFSTDATASGSFGNAHYRRSSVIKDDTEGMRFKEEY